VPALNSAPRSPAQGSPYLGFEVRSRSYGSHRVNVVVAQDDDEGEPRVVLVCRGCREEEVVRLV